MKRYTLVAAGMAALVGFGSGACAETLTIATVNNVQMVEMQKLSPAFTKETGIKLNWVVLEENVLRQRVTTDIATHGGSFDVITIGAYETPIWGKRGWLKPVDNLGASYDYADILAPVKAGLSYKGVLYAAPFYAESSFTMYRSDLFKKAGLTMPEQPTYTQIASFAAKLNDPKAGVYGICLRGKPGWGENMAYLSTLVNTMGGEWFNMKWQPQIDSPVWQKAISFYMNLMHKYGPPNATSNGFNSNLALFDSGKCAMWIDATSAAGTVFSKKESKVWNLTGVAKAPIGVTAHGAGWSWAWALAIPSSSKKVTAADKFLAWATSKAYIKLVAKNYGWVQAPPGTRKSTYDNPAYQKAAPFAKIALKALLSADPTHPTLNPVPYTGVQFVAIPEFQGIGTEVGQEIAAALAGRETVAAALKKSQAAAVRTMTEAGYIK